MESTYGKWETNIKICEKFMKPIHEKWQENLDFYGGDQWGDEVGKEERIVVNLIPRFLRIVLARVYFKNPYITVTPRGRQYEDVARLVEGAINYEQDEIMQKEQIERAIISALLYDFGVVKIGYSFKTEVEKQSEYIKKDQIFCCWIPSDTVFFDPEPYAIENCKYAFQVILKPLEEVQKNKLYKNTSDLKATATLGKKLLQGVGAEHEKKEYLKRVKLYEIWDIYNNKLIVLADGHKKILREDRMDEVFRAEGFPFKVLSLDGVPGSIFGRSMVTDLKAQQKELNRARSAELSHLKVFEQKYQYWEEDEIDPLEIEKFEKGGRGTVVKVRGKGIQLIPTVPYAAGASQSGRVQKEDMREISGIGEQQRGGAIPGVSTATEASIIERGVSLLTDEKLNRVEDFNTQIARCEIQLMRDNYGAERWAKIKGENGEFVFRKYTKEELQGEYEIKVEAGSTLPESKEARKKQAIDELNLYAHPAFDQWIDKGVLLEDTIQKTDGNPKILKPAQMGEQPLTEEEISAMQSGGMTPEEYKGALAEGETRRALLPRLLSKGVPDEAHLMSALARRARGT